MMKTLTKKSNLILALIVLLSTYLFASASIINISTNTDAVSMAIYNSVSEYNNAISVEFNFEEEEYINDIPFDKQCTDSSYEKAMSVDFTLDEELYIDDIPKEIIYKKL